MEWLTLLFLAFIWMWTLHKICTHIERACSIMWLGEAKSKEKIQQEIQELKARAFPVYQTSI